MAGIRASLNCKRDKLVNRIFRASTEERDNVFLSAYILR